jgi:hypothetical protein
MAASDVPSQNLSADGKDFLSRRQARHSTKCIAAARLVSLWALERQGRRRHDRIYSTR